jgi:UDP-glucose 4-epimerase
VAELSVCLSFDFDAMSVWVAQTDNPATISRGEFGAVAIARILALLDKHGARATFFIPGHTALAYNLGNGAGYSNRQVVEAARAITGHAIPIQELPRRLGDAPRLVAASDKIKRELGWQPQFPDLADIVASAWEWHRTHPHGYAAVDGGG